jgi:hypothetical protein
MNKKNKFVILLSVLFTAFFALSFDCKGKLKYEIGDCLMPIGANSPEKIIHVVAISSEYKVFTYFIYNGKLIQAQDYQIMNKDTIEKNYCKVECPSYDDTFSPDKYLNETVSK